MPLSITSSTMQKRNDWVGQYRRDLPLVSMARCDYKVWCFGKTC